ncbi:hypothetical protein DPEC_G00364760 [Dallia pectoralis]|nr:hypothetical protein DPEC_G00364760 [Dallia pectoralis]
MVTATYLHSLSPAQDKPTAVSEHSVEYHEPFPQHGRCRWSTVPHRESLPRSTSVCTLRFKWEHCRLLCARLNQSNCPMPPAESRRGHTMQRQSHSPVIYLVRQPPPCRSRVWLLSGRENRVSSLDDKMSRTQAAERLMHGGPATKKLACLGTE